MIQIDIENIIKDITPLRIQSKELIELLKVLSVHQSFVLNSFYVLFEKKRYEMAFNGQVMYLEHVLNDQFDPSLRRIHIGNSDHSNFVLYNDVENEAPTYMYNDIENEDPLYLFNNTEISYTFIIYVPIGGITDYNRFRSWVDKYKTKGKKYIIIEE